MNLTTKLQEVGATRMVGAWVITAVTLLVVAVFFPQQVGVVLLKVNLLFLAAAAGYWIDRMAFPYARPHMFADDTIESVASQIRRAIVIAAAMLAVALAL